MSDRPPFVSVVSLTYNRRESLRELLETLRQQTYPKDCSEVIVVDNASIDGTAEMVRDQFPEVVLIEVKENLGTHSYRYGVERTQGEFILMIDDDGLPVQHTWIGDVVTCFAHNPQLGAVACTIRMRDTGLIAHDNPQTAAEGSTLEGYLCPAYNGTGVGFRRSAIESVVSFYPRHMFHSWVELHLSTQLYEHGWQVRWYPDIEVLHCRPSTSRAAVWSYYGLRNYLWYVWELYPCPQAMIETVDFLGSRAKAVITGKAPVALVARSLRDALGGMKLPLRDRRPVSREVVRRLHEMRASS